MESIHQQQVNCNISDMKAQCTRHMSKYGSLASDTIWLLTEPDLAQNNLMTVYCDGYFILNTETFY